MSENDWAMAIMVFRAISSPHSGGRDDRKFLEALHQLTANDIPWRALPAEFGPWNSVWKRFWRLREAGVIEAFFETLAGLSETAHLVQMFKSTAMRTHLPAVGAKGISET